MDRPSDVIDLDDDFFSQIDVDDLVVKRQKTDGAGGGGGYRSTITKESEKIHNQKRDEEEGLYTAALRGSKSLTWQQQSAFASQNTQKRPANSLSAVGTGNTGSGGGGNDTCFKCGQLGHWSRDCTAAGGGGGGGGGGGNDAAALGVPEKQCPCNTGLCRVFVANTEKNAGRKFYRCPVREENGGCGFFEWCDNSSTPTSAKAHSYTSSSSFPDLSCPCGAGSCWILTTKNGKNVGQQFYRCPLNQENGCGFFKWCNEQTSASGFQTQTSASYTKFSDGNNRSFSEMSGKPCFKCNQDGHWARDCPNPLSGSSPNYSKMNNANNRSYSEKGVSTTCYKCGKDGHWAKDCTDQSPASATKMGGRSASSGTCFRCKKAGHYANKCPNPKA